jgi:hypothetical protein
VLIVREETRKAALEPACEAVLQHFALPELSLRCIFDDQERAGFLQHPELGEHFCGFFLPVRKFGIGHGIWAPELVAHIWDKVEMRFACDSVIYMRKRTCDALTGMVITFAHELQHFMQYGHHYQSWKSQHCIQQVAAPKLLHPRPWNFPGEYEAQLVSKRIAESVLGSEEVTRYTNARIADGGDIEKWHFFFQLNGAEEFDFCGRTADWIARYKDEIELYYPGLIQ